MDENKIPEVTAEDTAAAESVEAAEDTAAEAKEEMTETAEETAAETVEAAEDTAEAVEEAAENAADDAEKAVEESAEEAAEAAEKAVEETADDAVENAEATDEKPAKKKSPLQVPVIISLCIVVAALIGYFVFTGFFLKEPEGVTWSEEIDGATYYYEFKNDGTFNAYVGSVEIHSTYQKEKADDANTITVGSTVGNFYSGAPATYEITGSRLLGNQTLSCKYNEEYQFTVNQSSKKDVDLELPEDFTPDEELLGSWLFKYMNYDIYKVTFEKDGTMALEFIQDGIKYNGTYTLEEGTINFTYYVAESFATPLEYSIEGDTLNFMGYSFVREGSEAAEATPDQEAISVQ